MITTKYDFINPADFAFDSGKVEFTGLLARLKLQAAPGLSWNQPFTSDAGFTYDGSRAEFVGGAVRSKDRRAAGATFGATFTAGVDGNWGGGVLTGTASGGAAAAGGKLNLKGGTQKYVTYAAAGNAPNTQVGCIRLKYTPNYSGIPATNRYIFDLYSNPASDNNSLQIIHNSITGNLSARLCDSAGSYIFQGTLAAWSPTAGTEYEFEFDFDFTAGATRLFVNGTQVGSTITGVGTRTTPSYLRIGAAHDLSNSDGEFDDVEVFSSVQHTANYTPGYVLSETIYETSKVDCPAFTYSGAGSIQALTNVIDSEVNSPRLVMNGHYWTGTAWAASDGSWAQSNPIATVLANIATCPTAASFVVSIVFNAGASQMSVDDLTVTYTGQVYSTTNPTIKPNGTIGMDSLATFAASLAAGGSDAVKFTLEVDGTEKY